MLAIFSIHDHLWSEIELKEQNMAHEMIRMLDKQFQMFKTCLYSHKDVDRCDSVSPATSKLSQFCQELKRENVSSMIIVCLFIVSLIR